MLFFSLLQIPNISPLLHRDSNQMELRDLQPGTNYTVDLVFFTREDQTTQVSNTQPITFMTLPEEGMGIFVSMFLVHRCIFLGEFFFFFLFTVAPITIFCLFVKYVYV